MRSIAHLCQLSYNYIGLLDLWTILIIKPHCAFGAIGDKGSIVDNDYDSFQNHLLLRLQGVTIDANNTQAAVNEVLSGGGSLIITGWEESKPITFGPMLVTASGSGGGSIQLRDIDAVDQDNCTDVVSEECSLKEKLKDELSLLEYSGDADRHIYDFIRGLFGKSGMMLFGCGNAWKIEFDTNLPSTLNLKHNRNEYVIIPVTGHGKILKKD